MSPFDHMAFRCFNSNAFKLTMIKRPRYLRMYPTLMVYKDGSTVTVRQSEPRAIIKIPLLYEECKTDDERQAWMTRRKPIERITIDEDETDVKYDANKYLKILRNKARQ